MAKKLRVQQQPLNVGKAHALISGIKAELPIAIAVIPFGMIYGVLAVAAGIPPLVAQAMSSIVFAGSAQFITVQLIVSGAIPAVIVVTGAIVNLRHALYSASIAPFIQHLHPVWKWLLAYLLTDEAYAVAITHYQDKRSSENKHWFFLGAGLTLWFTWQVSSGIGIFLGAQVPESWSLDFTLALTFIGLVVPTLKKRSSTAAALLAGVTAVLLFSLPFKLGLIIAAMIGILTGMLVEVSGWNSGSR
jgi:4-azaleucine resistance transporter AzlC